MQRSPHQGSEKIADSEEAEKSSNVHSLFDQEVSELEELEVSFEKFDQLFSKFSKKFDRGHTEQLCGSLTEYCNVLVKRQNEEIFFQHSVENNFIRALLKTLRDAHYMSDVVKTVFSCLELILKAVKRDDQLVYFMVCINKEGFIKEKYKFEEQEDAAYFVNFLKLLARMINKEQKYLSIFFNSNEPEFPLLLSLLQFHNSKDQILSTSVKLTLMEVCSNVQNKCIQGYISNFPFVVFYPFYTYEIYFSFINSILPENQQSDSINIENLSTSLKFMQDFIFKKDKHVVEMYTNCFMTLLGRFIYQEMSSISEKSKLKVRNIFKILAKFFSLENSTMKVMIGLSQMLSVFMGKNLKKFLGVKTSHMNLNYYLVEECGSDIHSHCKKVYAQNNPKKSFISGSVGSSSIFRTFNSYIPSTKDNWFYHEVRKVEEMIGFQVRLNHVIDPDQYLEKSYLHALEKDCKVEDNFVENTAFHKMLRFEDEELVFYLLKTVVTVKKSVVSQHSDVEMGNVTAFLELALRATSLTLIKAFYQYVKICDIRLDEMDNPHLKQVYEKTLEKLIYFIMTEGWGSFRSRSKIDVHQNTYSEFSPDIFRDIECDLLFFIAVRHLLGTRNQDCEEESELVGKSISDKDFLSKEIKATCFMVEEDSSASKSKVNSREQNQLSMILDGQYIKLTNEKEQMITRESLLMNRIHLHGQQGTHLEIIQTQNTVLNLRSEYLCLEFQEETIKKYFEKEIKWRREIILELEMRLKLMMFPLKFAD